MRTYDHYLKSCARCYYCRGEKWFEMEFHRGDVRYNLQRMAKRRFRTAVRPQYWYCELWTLLHRPRKPRRQRHRAISNLRAMLIIFRDGWDRKYLKSQRVPRWLWPKPDEEKRFRDFYRREL